MEHLKRAAYFGNPFIGLFFRTNGKSTLFPNDTPEKIIEAVCESLGTSPVITNIEGTNLNGLYIAMNANGMVVPKFVSADEQRRLEKETGVSVYASKEKFNAHGNNIALNDMGGIISSRVKEIEKKAMEDCLGIELITMEIAGYTTVGSLCVANNRGFLVHYAASEKEIREMGEALKVKGMPGSVNLGNGFVRVGILATDNGYFAGDKTSAFELGRVEEALGFLD
jgi:translation initiation factor 6